MLNRRTLPGNTNYANSIMSCVRTMLLVLCSLLARAQSANTPQDDAAESFSFEHYGQTEGLSQGTINDMVSYDGFMWFATQDGLNRFDGNGFRVFRKGGPHTLSDNLVQALLADSQGRLWIGSASGLTVYDRHSGQFQTLQEAFGLAHPIGLTSINRLFEDRQRRIWVITDALGLFCFEPRTKKVRVFFPNDNTIQGNCVARDGRIWVSSFNEVFEFDPYAEVFRPMHIGKRLRTQSLIRTILLDKQDNLWIATSDDGAFVLERDQITHYQQGTTTGHLSSNDIATSLVDQAGRVWLGTRTGGICIYHPDTRQFSYVRHGRSSPRSLAEDFVWRLYQDQQGIIWVGNSSQGIDKYDPHRFPFGLIGQNDDPRQSLPDNMIFRISGQGDDLYIGTETGGAARYSLKTGRITPLTQTTPSAASAMRNETRVITADSDKNLWFANWRELAQYDPVRHTVRTYPVVGPRKQMYAFCAHVLNDSTGRSSEIWVGGPGGLTRFDVWTRQWKNWQDIPALNGVSAAYNIRLIYQHSPSVIWFGTLGSGLIGYDRITKQTRLFNEKNGLGCANVRSLLQVGQTLWVGTDCGLFRIFLDTMRVFRQYTKADGLPNEVIYSILPDNNEDLWLSSNQGLTHFSPVRGVIKNYDVTDGLQSNEFNTNVSYKHTDGTLFFGGVNGITYFKTANLRPNTFVPPVRITGISVLDSAYNPNRAHLTLGPDQNFIEFSFAALNFSNSRKNQYQYQLEGIDPGWVRAGHRHTANYTKLPPGEYTFRVKGSNDDGVWNERGTSVRVTITPPFWATLWFRLLLISLLVAGLYGVYRYRITQLRSRQAHELAVAVRTQELERQRFSKELHDGVGANLAVLKMYLSSLGSPTVAVDELKARSLAVLKSSIDEIRSIIHDMHPRRLAEEGLVQTIADMVELMNESHHFSVTFEPRNVPQKLPESLEINLFRVVQELMQNAVKHAHARTVRLQLHYEHDTLHLTYRDDGRGFTPARAGQSPGNGLVNIEQRVALMKGTYRLQSAENQGTTVEISVPVTT